MGIVISPGARRRIPAILLVASLAGGCADSSDDAAPATVDPTPVTTAAGAGASSVANTSPPATQPSQTAPVATVPTVPSSSPTVPPTSPARLDDVDCLTDPRFSGWQPPADVRCAELVVAEDRADPNGRQVVLPVMVYPPVDGSTGGLPVVYVSGGPGDSALGAWNEQRLFAASSEFVMVDLRGTGEATPSLECPEIDEANWRALEDGLLVAQSAELFEAAEQACLDRLSNEVDLDQYDTPTIALDLVDLRTALGYEQWVVYGVSYGTAAAQWLARIDQGGTALAILDSPVLPDRDAGSAAEAMRYQAAFERLAAGCAADVACDAAHPELLSDLALVVEELNASPYEVAFTDADGVDRTAQLNGEDIVDGGFRAMYDRALIPLLPSVISQLRAGEYGILDALAATQLPFQALTADGQNAVVHCADRAATSSHLPPDQLLAEYPLVGPVVAGSDSCLTWNVEPVPADFAEFVASEVPVVVLAGGLDPVTPASDGRQLAERLGSKATFVELPGFGHAVVFTQDECVMSIVNAAIDDPSQTLDTGCAATIAPIVWA